MPALPQDLRYGFRMLVKNPGFTIVVVLLLAVGIGANTAIFSAANEAFLRAAPQVADPSRVVALGRTLDGRTFEGFGHLQFQRYSSETRAFSGLAGYGGAAMLWHTTNGTQRVRTVLVTGDYFGVLGIRMVAGRGFTPDEDRVPGGTPVAVVSHSFWQNFLAADPNIIGKSVRLNTTSFTLVGVAPEGFRGVALGQEADLWIPLMMEGATGTLFPTLNSDFFHNLSVVGRLREGVGRKEAAAEMAVLASRIEEPEPKTKQQAQVRLASDIRLTDPDMRKEAVRILALLAGIVGSVLLIVCANVANLLLARATIRRKEISVRLALGATRLRLLRQLLTESALLSLLGCAAGLPVSWAVLELLRAYVGRDFAPALDIRVLGFSLGLSLLTGLAFGLLPALQACRTDLVPALKEGAQGGYRRPYLRDLLVIGQISLSLMLLMGAGLFLQTLRHAMNSDLGFQPRNLWVLRAELGLAGYNAESGSRFSRELAERVAAMPGVVSVGRATTLPRRGNWFWGPNEIYLEGREPAPGQPGTQVEHNEVSPGYLATLGISLIAGRDFQTTDTPNAPGVAIINEAMARACWPNENPLGKRFRVVQFMGLSAYREVVGVMRNSRTFFLGAEPVPEVYTSLDQNPATDTVLIARTRGDSATSIAAAKRAVNELDPGLPPVGIRTFAGEMSEAFQQERMDASFSALFGALALVLAVVGLYSTLAYVVARRTREIGIRMALGAQRSRMVALILGRGMGVTLIGIVTGGAASLAMTRLVRSRLYGVTPTDPVTFALVALVLAAAALTACYFPARKASKVDPQVALRCE